MKELIERLERERDLTNAEFAVLLDQSSGADRDFLFERARAVRDAHYGRKVYIRGLIELTNYCKNDCLYCGIRKSNASCERYRLTKEQILSCCESGYALGFRTFVLQGGEDGWYTDERMTDIVRAMRQAYPDCAITLSLGERGRESFKRLYDAGANRYLLRHETADEAHYARLHPASMTLTHRLQCLRDLKEIGFQTGAGFMVGSPYQTTECIVRDFRFLQELRPQMVGLGPFIPHHATPLKDFPAGSTERTLLCLSIVRLLLPNVLLPATTALATIDGDGRIKGMNAGCNVVMPNLSPLEDRSKYLLYDNKASSGEEAAESLRALREHLAAAGYEVVIDRGDYKGEGK
jgi:biotin synthase